VSPFITPELEIPQFSYLERDCVSIIETLRHTWRLLFQFLKKDIMDFYIEKTSFVFIIIKEISQIIVLTLIKLSWARNYKP